MKKAGIFTFHNAENYGAALQTYALMKTVQNLGCDCQVIDYRNRGVFLRNSIKTLYYFLTFQNPRKNQQVYRNFQKHYMNLTAKTYRNISAFEKDADRYDFLLFGSDQIWNPDLSNGFDPIYFGQFSTQAKKITYAASLGKDNITPEERQKLNQLLTNFDAIAVREETMLPIIDQDVTCVLDPCMLLTREEWLTIAEEDIQEKEYILVYQLHADKNILSTAKSLSFKYGKQVRLISPYLLPKKQDQTQKLGRISPNALIAYFHQADMVLSDSFHGTIFSILFEKPFFTILPGEKTGRITSLLGKLQLSDRIVSQDHLPSPEIDYDSVKPLLEKEINNSIDYLRRHIK